jgi:hypothetical protein
VEHFKWYRRPGLYTSAFEVSSQARRDDEQTA